MPEMTIPTVPLRRALAVILIAMAAAAAPRPAAAQQVVAIVNGDPITALDIAQRTRLHQISTQRSPSREDVLNELIDEKLKLQVARRFKLDVTDAEVMNVIGGMAQRSRLDTDKFLQSMQSAGVGPANLKSRIRADIGWAQIVRGKFQASLQISDKDVSDALDLRKTDQKAGVAYEYTLRPILFVIAKGAAESVVAARRREADGLRARFQNCDEGLALARGLKDVAVRGQIVRNSADFPPGVREILDKIEVGRLSPPDQNQSGIELFAVCGKKEVTSDSPGKREKREEMFAEKFNAQAKKYLQQLRRNAMIEMR